MKSDMNRYLRVVEKLADRICEDALWYENLCNWIGVFNNAKIANSNIALRALPSNFYNGSAGVGFFLAAAYHQFQKPSYKKTAIGAFNKTIGQIHKIRVERIGFYEGLSGIAYSLIQGGEWLSEDFLIDKGKKIIEEILISDNLNWDLDMQEGCTGVIPVILYLNKKYRFSNIEAFTETVGNYILNTANKSKKGWSWKTIEGDFPDMTGYAHGVAGITHTMIELFHFTKNNKYLEAAKQAIKYENSFYNNKYLNWKDVRVLNRKGNNRRAFALSAWCVGSVGIGFSRLKVFQVTGENNCWYDALNALKNSSLKVFEDAQNYSLCHGIFGDLTFLLWASHLLNDMTYEELVHQKLTAILEKYNDFDTFLPDSSNTKLENPSFMLGWAGIAYFLLQVSNPKNFPDILLVSSKE